MTIQRSPDVEVASAAESFGTQSELTERLDKLRTLFATFRDNRGWRVGVRLRQQRAAEIRAIIDSSPNMSLEDFDSEIWLLEKGSYIRSSNQAVRTIEQDLTPEALQSLEQALDRGDVELHGNFVWRPSTGTFGANLSIERKRTALHDALRVLRDDSLDPLTKAQKISGFAGFGQSTASGLVMLVHPTQFMIANRQSMDALKRLELPADSLEVVQESARRLFRETDAIDFLELDAFLYLFANDRILTGGNLQPRPVAANRRYWWVNQGKSYPVERDGGYIRGEGVTTKGIPISAHQRMKEMGEGDLVLHYHAGAIHAVGTVTGPIEDTGKTTDLRVDVAYSPLAEPIARTEFPADLLPPSTGPFNKLGKINQGYLYELRPEWMQRFGVVFAGRLPEDVTFPVPPSEPGLPTITAPSLQDLAARSHHNVAELEEIESLLHEKKQLIFEGPPGSGKTYLADLFARYVTGNPLDGAYNEQIEVVQFHQSYGYEDFVQGIRPVTDGEGRLQYRVVPGIFLQQCERARANPEKPFVLIIDEINRGNLSRIFGELLMLLEYRDRRVRLPYGSGDGLADHAYLQIPPNLYVIGTMNSTDRSLAMIDYALRRRFYFYRLMPVVGGKAIVLERWLETQEFGPAVQNWVLATFLQINSGISTHLSVDYQVGHSYFMATDIGTPGGMDRIWRRALRPLLEEYFHTARGSAEIIAGLTPAPAPTFDPDPDSGGILDADA